MGLAFIAEADALNLNFHHSGFNAAVIFSFHLQIGLTNGQVSTGLALAVMSVWIFSRQETTTALGVPAGLGGQVGLPEAGP
jgi:hypothetical protein